MMSVAEMEEAWYSGAKYKCNRNLGELRVWNCHHFAGIAVTNTSIIKM